MAKTVGDRHEWYATKIITTTHKQSASSAILQCSPDAQDARAMRLEVEHLPQ